MAENYWMKSARLTWSPAYRSAGANCYEKLKWIVKNQKCRLYLTGKDNGYVIETNVEHDNVSIWLFAIELSAY